MDRDIYLGDVDSVLLQPPELDAKKNTELGDLETQVPGISITEQHNYVWDVIELLNFLSLRSFNAFLKVSFFYSFFCSFSSFFFAFDFLFMDIGFLSTSSSPQPGPRCC